MLKFIKNFMYVLVVFIVFEILLYIKDYNEVKVIEIYIKHDIITNNFIDINNEKYIINISYKEEKINYQIIYDRNTIFKFNFLKKINHHGII